MDTTMKNTVSSDEVSRAMNLVRETTSLDLQADIEATADNLQEMTRNFQKWHTAFSALQSHPVSIDIIPACAETEASLESFFSWITSLGMAIAQDSRLTEDQRKFLRDIEAMTEATSLRALIQTIGIDLNTLQKRNAPMKQNPLFDERRAVQAAAFLLSLADGHLPILKLTGLLYLAERLSLQRYGYTLTGDNLMSMPHGPALVTTLELVSAPALPDTWKEWISTTDRLAKLTAPGRIYSPKDLEYLSEADIEVLEETWKNFGGMGYWKLVDYMRKKLPEWKEPKDSNLPISYGELLRATGYSSKQAQQAEEELAAQQYIAAAFA
jgi:uncharacterized phage-associated protein